MSFWAFETKRGTFYIIPHVNGRFILYWGEDMPLGSYHSPEAAADDAGGGHHPSLPCFPDDGASLGVERDLPEWTFVRR